jgi:hypothetical protein
MGWITCMCAAYECIEDALVLGGLARIEATPVALGSRVCTSIRPCHKRPGQDDLAWWPRVVVVVLGLVALGGGSGGGGEERWRHRPHTTCRDAHNLEHAPAHNTSHDTTRYNTTRHDTKHARAAQVMSAQCAYALAHSRTHTTRTKALLHALYPLILGQHRGP